MVARLYSKQFLAVTSPSGPASGVSATVPAGFVWDIRDVHAVNLGNPDGPSQNCGGFQVTNSATVVVFAQIPAWGNKYYHYDGRQILSPGDHLEWSLLEEGWTLSVAGYELAVP